MFTKTIRAGATSITALALALSLTACGSDDPDTEATTEPTTPAATAEPTTPETEPSTPEEKATEEADAANPEEALDQYIALEQQQLDAAGDSLKEIYSEVTIVPEYPGTAVFTYTYAQPVDAQAAATELDALAGDLEELCQTAVFPAMESLGVGPDQAATYVYKNADGTEIWSRTFTS